MNPHREHTPSRGRGGAQVVRDLRAEVNRLLVPVVMTVILTSIVVGGLLRPRSGGRIARRLILLLAPLLGVSFEVHGAERLDPEGSYVLAPNHSSPLDIPGLLVASPDVAFAATAELFRTPVLAAAMRALRTIPLERGRPEAARRAFAEAVERLGAGARVVIFPEGRMAPPGELLRFKSGAFLFAIAARVPVVPVAIHGASALMPRHARMRVRPGRVVVELLGPIPTDGLGFADRHTLRERIRSALEVALGHRDGGRGASPGGPA